MPPARLQPSSCPSFRRKETRLCRFGVFWCGRDRVLLSHCHFDFPWFSARFLDSFLLGRPHFAPAGRCLKRQGRRLRINRRKRRRWAVKDYERTTSSRLRRKFTFSVCVALCGFFASLACTLKSCFFFLGRFSVEPTNIPHDTATYRCSNMIAVLFCFVLVSFCVVFLSASRLYIHSTVCVSPFASASVFR